MLKKLLELITGEDNSTLEPAYVWWALSVVVGIGLKVYAVVEVKEFDLQQYGIGVGTLMALNGVSKKFGG